MSNSGALGDVIVAAIQELLRLLFSPITTIIQDHADKLVRLAVGTPHPNSVYNPPTNTPWVAIYDYYWDTIVPLSLLLWALAIGLVIFFETTSHLFSSYHRTKLKKRAFSGLLGILSWWWIAALSAQFVDGLAGYLVPSLSQVSLFQTLSFSAMGVLGLVISLFVDFILFALIALIYLIRQIVLYLFVLMMPILIALWVPGVGPFTLVSRFVRQLAGFYVPFLLMTLPVALLFRLGDLLGSSVSLSMGGLGAWLLALVIPIVAVISPLVLIWQAGAIFFIADRAAHRVSANRAQGRLKKAQEGGAQTAHGSRNFVRGVQGKPAVTRDGQYLLSSGDSRAHATGSRLNTTVTEFRTALRDGGGGSGGSGGGGGAGGSNGGEPPDSSRTETRQESRNENFETLRNRGTSRSDPDDRPRYIN